MSLGTLKGIFLVSEGSKDTLVFVSGGGLDVVLEGNGTFK